MRKPSQTTPLFTGDRLAKTVCACPGFNRAEPPAENTCRKCRPGPTTCGVPASRLQPVCPGGAPAGGPCPTSGPVGYSKLSEKRSSPRTVEIPNDKLVATVRLAKRRRMTDCPGLVFLLFIGLTAFVSLQTSCESRSATGARGPRILGGLLVVKPKGQPWLRTCCRKRLVAALFFNTREQWGRFPDNVAI